MSVNSSFDQNKHIFDLSKGSELAFTILYDKYKNVVYSTALKITKSTILAEEVVQDVFLKIWQKKENLIDIENFENYLFISGRNHIFNMIKKIARETALRNKIGYDDFSYTTADTSLEDEQYNRILNQIIEQLPPQQQKVFRMARIEGYTHQEIAEQLQISTFTIKRHMNEALKFIKFQLSRHIDLILLIYFTCLSKTTFN
ncbi:RNA polymerase sigma factor [Flavobacterium pectinovorum]|uniref:RNA polymerase sigma factor n=1 Tax=Flavobacterium pectinovorum TaxID=29533 RepID=UPI001FAB691E|nr:RNA polymerase sigma-70 factor [Flavobacterium pectinovorum]MCI9843577.1 RNA polymerase sigma-70 factor [Flavobacterium pectinovorum]